LNDLQAFENKVEIGNEVTNWNLYCCINLFVTAFGILKYFIQRLNHPWKVLVDLSLHPDISAFICSLPPTAEINVG
jgi:hypothetical protein